LTTALSVVLLIVTICVGTVAGSMGKSFGEYSMPTLKFVSGMSTRQVKKSALRVVSYVNFTIFIVFFILDVSIDAGVESLAEALSVTFDHRPFCNTWAPK